ncbi:MAG: N-acyl homoserine lactonase family protein [Gemmatimonadota bacterium]
MKKYVIVLLGALAALVVGSHDSAAQSPLKLYVFDCGRIQFDSVAAFGVQDEETDVRELIVPCYVIEHEKGRLLWNAGLPPSLAETEGWQEQDGARARLDRTLPEQLAELGLGMDDFDYASFSHMHFDHVGAANELEGATVIMQKAEHDAAFADSVTVPGFNPAAYEGLRDEEFLIIEGDHDVFGDGTVRIISTPGHTPGHQSLFVDLPQTGPIVLSGDLYHFRLSRELRRVPTFNVDPDATLASMDRLESLVEETGAELWIEHELARFEELKKAPEFYE